MRPEFHLFIIWEKGRNEQAKILSDLQEHFTIFRVFEIHWTKRNFSRNLSRFYGQKLPKGSGKERHCGSGPFVLIIVEDDRPIYAPRMTSKGELSVNTNPFNAKERYRSWTGGGHRIHATNSQEETEHDITLLLGVNSETFRKQQATRVWNSQLEPWPHDLVGADEWDDLGQLFTVLNSTVNYVMLRNFEALVAGGAEEVYGDIDLLTDNYIDLRYIANAVKVFPRANRVHHRVRIGGNEQYFDFRYVGDDYYDAQWQRDILAKRYLAMEGFYRPDEKHHFYGLLYHALVHKQQLRPSYVTRLTAMAQALDLSKVSNQTLTDHREALQTLDAFLNKQGYAYTEPRDFSVYFDLRAIGQPLSLQRNYVQALRRGLAPIKRRLRQIIPLKAS